MANPKYFFIIILLTLFISESLGQLNPKVEVQGNLESSGKMSQAEKPTNPNDLVTKSHMDSVIINLVLILDEDNGIQKLLDLGYTPKELMDNGIPLTSILNKFYGGGIICYLESNGTGLILNKAFTARDNLEWGCQGTDVNTEEAFGTGLQNSIAITSACRESNIAAKVALDFDNDGFDDWYLPSKGELEVILATVGEQHLYSNGTYTWTSTQVDAIDAFAYNQSTNQMEARRKGTITPTLLIRSF